MTIWVCGWPVLKWSTATQSSFGVEVALHLGEQVADEGLEVGEPGAVLGRDDEPELVRVLPGAVEEGRAIRLVVRGVIEMAGDALAGDAIAQDVLEVGAGGAEVAADDPGVARLDDDAAAAGRDQAGGGADAGAHAALESGGRDVAFLPQGADAGFAGLAEDPRRMLEQARAPRVAHATELGLEVVLRHDVPRTFCEFEVRCREGAKIQDGVVASG